MKKTIGLFGCGSLGAIIARAINDTYLPGCELIGVTDAYMDAAKKLSAEIGVDCYDTLADLIAASPDYIIEAAAPDALKEVGEKILRGGCHLIALSVGALAEEEIWSGLEKAAIETGKTVYLPSGAIGGFDVMLTAKLMGELTCRVMNTKAPESLNGAPFLQGRILPADREEEVFTGSAREAIRLFPKNVNVAVAAALATAGVDKTSVTIRSVPGMEVNRHVVEFEGDAVMARLQIDSKPSKENPKSSAMAAWSVIVLLQRLSSPIVFG